MQHRVADLSSMVVATFQDSQLTPNSSFYSGVSLGPFQAISYSWMTELGFPGFDPPCSLKDLVWLFVCLNMSGKYSHVICLWSLGSKTEYMPICRNTQQRHHDTLRNLLRLAWDISTIITLVI